jgi:O-antigen/teichoic acid export membrane protein
MLSDLIFTGENFDYLKTVKKIFSFSVPVLFINFGLMLLNNLDMILVKNFFTPEIAGYYAGTVTLGKLLLFSAGIVTTVMFPQISALYAKKDNTNKKFKEFLILQLVFVVATAAIFVVFPRLITQLFFGKSFLPSAQFLPSFSIFISLYVLINFMVMYFLAINQTGVVFLLVPGVFLQYFLITSNHASIYDVIKSNILVCIIVLTLLMGNYYRCQLQKEKNCQTTLAH